MTNESMNLQALLEKTTEPDFLREMIGFTAQRLMALELETLTAPRQASGAPTGLIGTVAGNPGRESRAWHS
jgi:hypothetical protein